MAPYGFWTRLDHIPSDDAFGVWIRVLIAINTLSLLIDAVDAIRYLAGDREEMVKNLSVSETNDVLMKDKINKELVALRQ